MSYTDLTKTELLFIKEYHEISLTGREIAKNLLVDMKQFIVCLDS